MAKAKETQSFSTREVPWMKVGEVIDAPLSAHDAMTKAGLDFDVELREVAYKRSNPKPKASTWVASSSRRAIQRVGVDDGEPFGWATDTYEIVQYREAFDFIDEIKPNVVSAGGLKGGRQAFMVVKVPDHIELDVAGGDAHELYGILRTSHDVTRAVEFFIMPLRGKCMNQLPLSSFGKNAPQRWSVRHVTGAQEKMREAMKIVSGLDNYAKEFKATAEKLAAIDIELADAEKLLRQHVLPDRPRTDKVIQDIGQLFDHGETVGYPKTGWGLVNAVGEYFDWHRTGGSAESQFTNALQGSTNRAVNRTAQVLLARR